MEGPVGLAEGNIGDADGAERGFAPVRKEHGAGVLQHIELRAGGHEPAVLELGLVIKVPHQVLAGVRDPHAAII